MAVFGVLLYDIFLFAMLMLPGFILGKAGKLSKGSLSGMTDILMYVAMPALAFNKLLEIDPAVISLTDIAVCIAAPFIAVFGVYFLCRAAFKGKRLKEFFRECCFCSVFSNCGFMGIPLAEVLFPERPEIALYIALYNVGSTFLFLTFGVYILSGGSEKSKLRLSSFLPITCAIALGVLCLALGLGERFEGIGVYSGYLAGLTTPLSMIILGAEFSHIGFASLFRERNLYAVSAMKLIACPAVAMLLLFLLSAVGVDLSHSLITAVFIATAVSTAASAPAMAAKCGCSGEQGAILTLGTTLLCMVTLPALYMLLNFVIGW